MTRRALRWPRPGAAVRLLLGVRDDGEQARRQLARQHDWLRRHRGTGVTTRADWRSRAFWELLDRR